MNHQQHMKSRSQPSWLCLAWVATMAPVSWAGVCSEVSYQCAFEQVQAKDLTTAVANLQSLLSQQPSNLKARNLLGIALTQSGQISEGSSAFRKALALDPAFYPAAKNLAFNELQLKHYDQARSLLEQVLQQAPDDAVTNLYLAEMEWTAQEHAAAAGHYSKAKTLVLRDPLLIFHSAQCSVAAKHMGDAVEWLDALPADGAAQFQAGLLLAHAGDYADAVKHFQGARALASDPYPAGYNQLLSELNASRFAAALATGEQLSSQPPFQRAEFYNLLSKVYLKNDRLQQSYDALRTAVRLDPKDESNYLDLASLSLDHQNYDLAREILTIGLRRQPASGRLRLALGIVDALTSRDAEARNDFTRAMEFSPHNPLPRFALALEYLETGGSQQALGLLEEEQARTLGSALLSYLYAVALTRQPVQAENTTAKATAALRRSIQLDPTFSHSHAELGKLLARSGQMEAAKQELRKAIELNPADSVALSQLLQVYQKLRDHQQVEITARQLRNLKSSEREAEGKRSLFSIIRLGATAQQAALMDKSSSLSNR